MSDGNDPSFGPAQEAVCWIILLSIFMIPVVGSYLQ